jgi:hypothetical protein
MQIFVLSLHRESLTLEVEASDEDPRRKPYLLMERSFRHELGQSSIDHSTLVIGASTLIMLPGGRNQCADPECIRPRRGAAILAHRRNSRTIRADDYIIQVILSLLL